MHKQVYKCPNHTGNLNNMRLNNRWCDLTIKVDGKDFRAHKNILAANLNYFDTMLSGDSFRESKEGVITMECVNATDVEAFITYAYTGEISLTDDNALSLLETANYFGEDGIKQACIEFLEKHLKAEESFRAYNYAKSIDCLSLKNAAKSKILLNFENSSQSREYLDLDFESVADVLSDAKAQSVKSQQIFFEGIVRWILLEAKQRRIRINNLLSLVDTTKLTTDYLMKFVGSIANHSNEDFAIVVKDLISWYYTCRDSSEETTDSQEPVPESNQDPLAFLSSQPEFQQMRHAIQQNPQLLNPVLQQIGQINPAVLQFISQNQKAFFRLLNEPGSGGGGNIPASAASILGGNAGAGAGTGPGII